MAQNILQEFLNLQFIKTDNQDNIGLLGKAVSKVEKLLTKKKDKIIVQDTNTLYYYHNRMNGYGLEKYI